MGNSFRSRSLFRFHSLAADQANDRWCRLGKFTHFSRPLGNAASRGRKATRRTWFLFRDRLREPRSSSGAHDRSSHHSEARSMENSSRRGYALTRSLTTGADRYRPDRSGQSWRVEAHVVLVNPRANQNCHQQRCCWSNRIRFGGFGSPRGLIRPHVARVHACVTRAANKQQARSSVTPWRGGIKLTRAGDGIGCHCRRPS